MKHKACGCESYALGHPTVHLDAYGQSGCIDSDIVPLISFLWEHGVRTGGSCQDTVDLERAPTGLAHIAFRDPVSLDRGWALLAWAAAQSEDGGMFLRATQQPSPGRFHGPVGLDLPAQVVEYDLPMWSVDYKHHWWVHLAMPRPQETRHTDFGGFALWLPASDARRLSEIVVDLPELEDGLVWPQATGPLEDELMFFIRGERGE